MTGLLPLVSLLSLGETYESFLKRIPIASVTPGTFEKIAQQFLAKRGLKPDYSQTALVLNQIKHMSEEAGVRNAADALLQPEIAKVFFEWAVGKNDRPEGVSMDALTDKMATLNLLKEMDFVPTGDEENFAMFGSLLRSSGLPEDLSNHAIGVYWKAHEKSMSIKELLRDPGSRQYLISFLATIAGDISSKTAGGSSSGFFFN